MRRPNHDLNWLVCVPEECNGCIGRKRFFAPGKGAGFGVGLEHGDDLLAHLLEIGHLVKRNDVPEPDQPHLSRTHVVEEVGNGGRSGQQDAVGGNFLVGIRFPCSPWTQFHHVVVMFAEGDEADKEEQFKAAVEKRGLQPQTPDEEIDPLVGAKHPASFAVLL